MRPLLALLAGGALLFNAAVTPGKVAGRAQKALQKAYPGAQVVVRVEGRKGRDVLRGRFKHVRVSMAHLDGANAQNANAQNASGAAAASTPAASTPAASTPAASTAQSVSIETVARAAQEGRIGRLDVELRDFTALGIHIEAARLESDDLRFDWKALQKNRGAKVVGARRTWAWARVGASGVAALVGLRLPGTREIHVALRDGRVFVTGRRDFAPFGDAPFVLDARPVGAGNTLRLDDARLSVSGLQLPQGAAGSLVEKLNPVFVFDKDGNWPARVNLRSVTTDDNTLEVEADIAWKTP